MIDNSAGTSSDRIKNTAGITLNGGSLVVIGGNSDVSEIMGDFDDRRQPHVERRQLWQCDRQDDGVVHRHQPRGRQLPEHRRLRAGPGDDEQPVAIREQRRLEPDRRRATRSCLMPTLFKAGDVDFATYDPVFGVTKQINESVDSFAPNGNVKLTAGTSVPSSTAATINALLFKGSGINLNASNPLTINSGVIVGAGDNNQISGSSTVTLGGTGPATIYVPLAATFDRVGSAVDQQCDRHHDRGIAIDKLGAGRLTLSGTNTYTGATNVLEGVVRAGGARRLGPMRGARW